MKKQDKPIHPRPKSCEISGQGLLGNEDKMESQKNTKEIEIMERIRRIELESNKEDTKQTKWIIYGLAYIIMIIGLMVLANNFGTAQIDCTFTGDIKLTPDTQGQLIEKFQITSASCKFPFIALNKIR